MHFYTMPDSSQIYDLIEERRLELGLSQAEVGQRAFGKRDNSFFQNIRRGSAPSSEKLAALAEALGLEFYFGHKRPSLDEIKDFEEQFAKVPRFDAQFSAGNGSINSDEDAAAWLAFRKDWFQSSGLSPRHVILVTAHGDSMEPSLSDGDLVMVDRSERPFQDRTVYAFVDQDGQARIKRLERVGSELLIQSDNPSYPTEIMKKHDQASMNILGPVVWSAHSWSDG